MKHIRIVLAAMGLFLALTGFDCASSEMTTAKLAMKQKDLAKAEESLRKEVAARPNNGEAWFYLGEIYYEQGRFAEMAQAYTKAEAGTQPAISTQEKSRIVSRVVDGWVRKFNASRDLNEQAIEQNNDAALFRRALAELDTADMLRPGYPDHLFLRANIYTSMQDQANTDRAYRDYIRLIGPDVEQGLEMGLQLGMTADQLQSKVGKAEKIQVTDSTGGFAYYPAKNLYVYFAPAQSGARSTVDGWKFYTADDPIPTNVREQLGITLRSTAHYLLGYDAYSAGQTDPKKFDEAIELLRMVEQFDPRREDVGTVVADIYVRTNRIDEAMTRLDREIARDPKNPYPYLSSGRILSEQKAYQRAIDRFKKVLDLGLQDYEKPVQNALFNIAAVYNNWGGVLKDSIDNVSNRKPTDAQREAYSAPLREAVVYFERLRAIGSRRTDFSILSELAKIYSVLGQNDKMKRTIAEIEAVEQIDDNAKKASYWRVLSQLYSITGNIEKANMADKKATDLGG